MSSRLEGFQPVPGHLPKWHSASVSVHHGTLDEVRAHVPDFERRDFALSAFRNEPTRPNKRLDMIVRKPFRGDHDFIPVGIVSKGYGFVQHTAVFDVAAKALESMHVEAKDVQAELKITEYGERAAISFYFPEKYSFDPGDGHPLKLRLECFNSMDGSTRFRAFMGWFRLVCSNGLIVGITHADVRRRHLGEMQLEDIGDVLVSGLRESERDKKDLEQWHGRRIELARLARWADEDLRRAWGFKAAARALHIARTGYDAIISGPYKRKAPSTIAGRKTVVVPGAPSESRNLYDISQVLSWLAQDRRDVQEQLQWREQIADLIKPLLN